MSAHESSESTLETAAGVAGESTTEAFKLLGNETRLAILLALWEAYEPFAEDNTVSFSELRNRVGMRDSGHFNYHLEKLTDHFVEAVADGYQLRDAGHKLVRTVIAGTGIEESALGLTEIDISCHRCGEHPVRIGYEKESLYLTCSECEGFTTTEEFPRGILAIWDFDPAGLARRNPQQLFVAGLIRDKNHLRQMEAGICPACSGAVDSSLRICEEHTPESGKVCPHCEMQDSVRVRYRCTVCKNWDAVPVQATVKNHPAVISFLHERDVDMTFDIDDVETSKRTWELFWELDHALISADPIRIRVVVPCQGDELHLLLDEELDVIEVSERN